MPALSEHRLILHIGGAKCGSSALQTTFSLTDWDNADSALVYAALHPVHGIVQGLPMRVHALRAPHGYAASPHAEDLAAAAPDQRQAMFQALRSLAAGPRRVILSNENWLPRAGHFVTQGLLDEIGLPFEIFAVVRPQVEFMNSGWWQWGAWEGLSLEDWVRKMINGARWARHLDLWQSHPNFREAKVRLLSKDIVGDFFAAFGAARPPGIESGQVNGSLPGDILRLYQRNRQLRPGPHLPATDFVISRLGIAGAPTPWVIPSALAEEVIEASRADNERLLAMLPEDEAARMRANPAWWSAEAFADKPLQSPLPQEPDAAALDRLCAGLVEALVRQDQELRQLRSKAAAAAGKPKPGPR